LRDLSKKTEENQLALMKPVSSYKYHPVFLVGLST